MSDARASRGDESDTFRAVSAEVRRFYDELPFNFHGSVSEAVRQARGDTVQRTYPDLHALLASGRVRRVVEIGCGVGWLANSLALHYGVRVTAIDFCSSALVRARDVSRELGLSEVAFVLADLFTYEAPADADLVVSLGVLHHTPSAKRAFEQVQRLVAAEGSLYLGLYHRYGRRPFLQLFREVLESEGEDRAFEVYRRLDPRHGHDATHARSWFLDQVMHPHEADFTLREVVTWFEGAGFRLRSTSLNRFGPIGDLAALYELEPQFEERSRMANRVESRFFPGFFTVLADRDGRAADL